MKFIKPLIKSDLKNILKVSGEEKTGCTKSIRKQIGYGFLEARIQWNNLSRFLTKHKDRTKTLSDMQTLVDSYVWEPPITLELPHYGICIYCTKTGVYPGFFSGHLRGRPQFQEM